MPRASIRGPLEGQVALVTGAGRGIGRAISLALAEAGAAVGLVARSRAELDDTRLAIERAGGASLPVAADVTVEKAVRATVRTVEETLGPVDLLVNNAGRCGAVGPSWTGEADEGWRDVEVNLRGPYLFAREVMPGMAARRSGRIVNVSSYAATRPDPYTACYGASKAALVHLTASIAEEARPHGVFVFAVAPGTVETEMTRGMRDSEEGRRWLPNLSDLPPERWLPPERAGALVVALAAGRGDPLSGRFLHVLDDLDDLVRRADEIERLDLYALRLSR